MLLSYKAFLKNSLYYGSLIIISFTYYYLLIYFGVIEAEHLLSLREIIKLILASLVLVPVYFLQEKLFSFLLF